MRSISRSRAILAQHPYDPWLRVLKKIKEPVKDLTQLSFPCWFFHLMHQLFEIFSKANKQTKGFVCSKKFHKPKAGGKCTINEAPNQCFS